MARLDRRVGFPIMLIFPEHGGHDDKLNVSRTP